MSQLKRHIGRLKNTDRKIVVIYMQIPGKTNSALIVDTDALPDQFHEYLMTVVESDVAQNTVNLADVLDRRPSPDAGINLMNSLHRRGFIRPEPVDNIIMFPRPNMPFPLSKIIELSKKESQLPVTQPLNESLDRYNQFTENMNFDDKQKSIDIAKSLLFDADLLQQEVIKKQNKAYEIAPSLRPKNEPRFSNQIPSATNQQNLSAAQSVEYQEIMARAQEHLDRAVYREEHCDELLPIETKESSEPVVPSVTEKKPPRPKKKTG
jgi:hypothetical protein